MDQRKQAERETILPHPARHLILSYNIISQPRTMWSAGPNGPSDTPQEAAMQTVQPETVGLSSARLQRIRSVMQRYVDRQVLALE
jgi:hypothetical protein